MISDVLVTITQVGGQRTQLWYGDPASVDTNVRLSAASWRPR